ncbi:MAG: sugar phosphate nucleotidyltransferase [Thermoplasmatota archaeon]
MKAIVMAGGEGTRLRPLTEGVPKPFVRIAGKPAIEYVLERLRQASIRDIIITTYYKPLQMIERLEGGEPLGLRLFYSIEDEPMGTAGGVRKASALLDGTFVVASGDVLADVDIKALIAFHREHEAIATMALTHVDDPSEYGVVAVDEVGRVTRFQEKPKKGEAFSNLINAGIYVLEPAAIALVPPATKFDFSRDLFPKLLAAGAGLYGAVVEGLWMDVGRPSDLLLATRRMAERRFGGPFVEGARLAPSARAPGSHLYPGATLAEQALVEDSILYDQARVGAGAVVRRSILCEGADVGAGAVVEDCVLGAWSHVPSKVEAKALRLPGGATAGESD